MRPLRAIWRRFVVRGVRRFESAHELAVTLRRKAARARREEKKLIVATKSVANAMKELLVVKDQKQQENHTKELYNSATNAFDAYGRELAEAVTIFSVAGSLYEDVRKQHETAYAHLVSDLKEGIDQKKAYAIFNRMQQEIEIIKKNLDDYRKGTRREARGRKVRGLFFSGLITSIRRAERDIIKQAKVIDNTFDELEDLFETLTGKEKTGDEEATIELFTNIINNLEKGRTCLDNIMEDYFIAVEKVRKEANNLIEIIERVKTKLPRNTYDALIAKKNTVEAQALKEARYYARTEARAA